jgi:alpha-L-fucosidase
MLQPWFTQARFGLFIHWGLYALPGTHEWHLHQSGDMDAYRQLADRFNPVDFDPAYWADLAWHAGMRYVVFTTKHHDGFCLFDNPHTDFNITRTPYGRDITAELLDAFRARGHRIGLYHSLVDWTHPHYIPDGHHPLGKDEPNRDWPDRDMSRYAEYLYRSVETLMSGYGRIDLLFWDFVSPWKKAADFRPGPLVDMIRRHQPEIIINDRLSDPQHPVGDYRTPEGGVPNRPPSEPWEVCAAMNYYWGYHRDAQAHMTPLQIQQGLMQCVSKGGNLLLNVGPDERGRIPDASQHMMEQLAPWFSRHESAVRGCGPSTHQPPDGCLYTAAADGELYLYLPLAPLGDVFLPGMNNRLASATILRDGVSLPIEPVHGNYMPLDEVRLKTGGSCIDGDVIRLRFNP